MALQTFPWFPDTEGSEEHEPKVQVTKFGDGYEARAAQGMNSDPATWPLSFTRGGAEALAIRAFLKARGAVEAFNWTNPFGETGTYVCDKWTVKRKGGDVLEISATFRQVFEVS